jgi:sulfite dehydrogenase (quinone) subunit SoeC
MNPAFSVILLTTLTGTSQGLFLAMFGAHLMHALNMPSIEPGSDFYIAGTVVSLLLAGGGLIASFFHLGRPERAWRTATMWRTSWLSREVIVLPAFMGSVALYGLGHLLDWAPQAVLAIGAAGAFFAVALFICTGMIYACLKFLQEWATPLTVVNYLVLGCASGVTLASAFAAFSAASLTPAFTLAAVALTLLGLATRSASLIRNSRIRHRSTLQSAIGIHHPRIVQKSQGLMGGSFNTREFFHHRTLAFLRSVKWTFLLLAFILPLPLLAFGALNASAPLLCLAFVIQYIGLLAERWYFFAQANHPQNLYYQTIS